MTCLVNGFFPEVGVATVRVLEKAGADVAFPADQTCCGQPAFNAGFRLCQGEIVLFLDSDDTLAPEALAGFSGGGRYDGVERGGVCSACCSTAPARASQTTPCPPVSTSRVARSSASLSTTVTRVGSGSVRRPVCCK